MPNARIKPGETAEQARLRYNTGMRAYSANGEAIYCDGRPVVV